MVQRTGGEFSSTVNVAKPDTGAKEDAVRYFDISTFRVSTSGRVENIDIRNCETKKLEVLCGLNKKG
jgi:hypothetical protein